MTLPSSTPSINPDGNTVHPSRTEPEPAPATLEVVAWPDPRLDGEGFDPRSLYAERFWLGLLGPSTLWMLRRFARGLETHPNGFRVGLADTGRSLGLGDSTARNSSTQRTLTRLCQFGLALQVEPGRLAVRTELPQLSRRQLSRLPAALQAAHQDWIDGTGHDRDERRALAAACGLARDGETFESIERQLRSWGYPSASAYETAKRAIVLERHIELH